MDKKTRATIADFEIAFAGGISAVIADIKRKTGLVVSQVHVDIKHIDGAEWATPITTVEFEFEDSQGGYSVEK